MYNAHIGFFSAFVPAFITGAAVCVIYDLIQMFVYLFKNNFLVRLAGDLLFGVLACLFAAVLFFNTTEGQIRLITVVCMVMGFTIWYLTLGRLTRRIFLKLVSILAGLISTLLKLISRRFNSIKRRYITNTAMKRMFRELQGIPLLKLNAESIERNV